jgi:hypothetical protein
MSQLELFAMGDGIVLCPKPIRADFGEGARAALPTLSRSNTRLGQWLRGLLARTHSKYKVVVALAANMTRTAGRSCATAPRLSGGQSLSDLLLIEHSFSRERYLRMV